MGADGAGDASGEERKLTGIDEARRRIAEAARTSATELDLGGLNLTEVPEELYGLTQLEVLYLGAAEDTRGRPYYGLTQEDKKRCNAVIALPPALFTSLPHLTRLHLDHNQLTGFPDQIAALTGLTALNLRDNRIAYNGARAIAALTGLTSLDLASNGIGEGGARVLAALTGLTSLNLRDNRIGEGGARAIAALTGLTTLNLANNEIRDNGAHALAALTGLTTLDLASNKIGTDGARAIATLTSLTSLDLNNNRIGADGARALAALTGLTSLDLASNGIGDGGARALAALTGLTSLNLMNDRIGADGARAIAALTGLTSLNLMNSRIGADGARAVAALAGLTSLDLTNNGIGDEGARALAALTRLTRLRLSGNGIGADGARALAALPPLTLLRLSGNQIGDDGARALLDAWADRDMSQLDRLHMANNEIGDLGVPAEAIESGDAQAILAAYRAFRQAKRQGRLKPLNEAKMLVVGNEAVGKTSLIRYLVHHQPRDPDEKKTEGTAIQEKIEIQDWSPDAADIKLNVWDFGGQEIMHGTHRYFLTRRSLYLLVLEDRREDNCPIHNWLKIIRNRGGDAPIIVVINKSDEGKEALRLDEDGLKRDYPEIVGFLRTSCDPGKWAKDSIHALRKMIAGCLAANDGLKEVRDAVPESWLWVKQRIAERARAAHVLPISEFEGLCVEAAEKLEGAENLKDKVTQRALLRLLHDLVS